MCINNHARMERSAVCMGKKRIHTKRVMLCEDVTMPPRPNMLLLPFSIKGKGAKFRKLHQSQMHKGVSIFDAKIKYYTNSVQVSVIPGPLSMASTYSSDR